MNIRDFITRVFNDNGGAMGVGDFKNIESKFNSRQISCALSSMQRRNLLLPAGDDKYVPNTPKWSKLRNQLQYAAKKKKLREAEKLLNKEDGPTKKATAIVKRDYLTIESTAPIQPVLLMSIGGQGFVVTKTDKNKTFHRYEFERTVVTQPAEVS